MLLLANDELTGDLFKNPVQKSFYYQKCIP